MKAPYWQEAVSHLRAIDPVLSVFIPSVAAGALERRSAHPFEALARCVVGQQISVAAADKIWSRLQQQTQLEPRIVLDHPNLQAAVGLSHSKAATLVRLAEHIVQERDLAPAVLLTIKGIGPWTIDMFQMFFRLEPDVLPTTDLGFVKGFRKLYAVDWPTKVLLSSELFQTTCQRWRPYRSAATWYMWRSIEAAPINY